MLIVSFSIFVLFMMLYTSKISGIIKDRDKIIDRQEATFKYVDAVVEKLSGDSVFLILNKQNKAIDSLEILIFVYNKRYMRDQQEIQMYRSELEERGPQKSNKLNFPNYIGEDSLKYEFGNLDSLENEGDYGDEFDIPYPQEKDTLIEEKIIPIK